VQLRDAKTKDEFIQRIAAFAKTLPKGTWIRNGDWDHTNWGGELPTRAWIDSVTPDNPVWINRLDGHMNLANSAALRAAGVDRNARDIDGGEIVRDASGEPTGVLKDNAMSLVNRVEPPRSAAEDDRALDAAIAYVAERGVTSVHDMGGWSSLATMRRARADGRLRIRVVEQVPLATWARLRDEIAKNGRGDEWLRIGGLKGFVDGSLGSHTAAMLAPFSDAPKDSGFFVTPPETLYEWTKAADAESLYRLLEEQIVPRFFDRDEEGLPHAWLGTMRAAVSASIWQFSTARMLIQYVDELYRPAVAAAEGIAVPA
jgi:predicted amidohydrolase YtcJ